MSYIDGRLGDSLRNSYLAEIKQWLPAFLAASTVERLDPLAQVRELLNIDGRDLNRVLAVHVLLQPGIQDLIGGLPAGMRSPATSSHKPRQLSRVVTGSIDWPATLRVRATGNALEAGFVTRPAKRLFDVAENRVLAWVLAEIDRLLRLAMPNVNEGRLADWQDRLRHSAEEVFIARRSAWLRDLSTQPPAAGDFATLSANRRRFYRIELASAASVIRRYTEHPSPSDVAQLLVQRWFEPQRDWQLFELVVLLRLERRIAEFAGRDRLRLITSSRGPVATYHAGHSRVIRLWYQAWPPSALPSELRDAMTHYAISGPGSRPDIVIEVQDGDLSAGLLLELKATRSADYLAAGLLQLMGYMRDRPGLFSRQRSGWLVAPAGAPFISRDPGSRHLWVVNADDVAEAVAVSVGRIKGGKCD
jgi:hypothetical protein